MDYYKIDGNKDLARDPDTGSIVNVNNLEYQQYVSVRESKKVKNESVEQDLANLKSEMNEIKSLLKELVNGH
tara:strand:- start:358 stop:573 length:216 start_codon:yes stop_codon:yes gene_type:complete